MSCVIGVLALLLQLPISGASQPVNFDLHLTGKPGNYLNYTRIPDLGSFTLCLWMKQKPADSGYWYQTVLSYANKDHVQAIEIQSIGSFKPRAALYHMGSVIGYTQFNLKDKQWHHLCFTWSKPKGLLASYVDGNQLSEKIATHAQKDDDIKGGGCFVLGHHQKTPCGSFAKAFTGMLSQVNMWSEVLNQYDVMNVYRSCDVYVGDVLPWKRSVLNLFIVESNVTSPSMACQSNYISGSFLQHHGRMLSGHSIAQLTVKNNFECAHACAQDYRCDSFNLIQKEGTYRCELNDSDMHQDPHHFIFAVGATYFGFADSLHRWVAHS